jgi:SAM-dependent methyltransferase
MGDDLSLKNSEYWSQLCGSRAARKLGITAGDPGGVAIFDEWFFNFYPYLADSRFIPWESLIGQSVLEIGLGYGSVTRRLSGKCGHLIALDIAPGPVRFAATTTPGVTCVRGSALALPFPDGSLDNVIAIGSLHHTGNMELAFRECMRVLRPGGCLVAMVYNRHSYKRWIVSPVSTFRSYLAERRGVFRKHATGVPKRVSWFWDRSPAGSAPPHTEFATSSELHQLLEQWGTMRVTTVNIDNPNDLLPSGMQRLTLDKLRIRLLGSRLSTSLGLDLYVVVLKNTSPDITVG